MGAPEEHDGLSPSVLSYSLTVILLKSTVRDPFTGSRVVVMVDLLPTLEPPKLAWSPRATAAGIFNIPRSVPTEEELLDPVLLRELSLSRLLERRLDFLNMGGLL